MRSGWAAQAGAAAHVFVDSLDDELTIIGDAGHHLARSLRLRSGEMVTAADGRGQWRGYVIDAAGRGNVELTACDENMVEPGLAPALDVAFAITKAAEPEMNVQKLTELGVDRIVLFASERSIPRWDDERTHAVLQRLHRVALESAVQSRRARLPVVEGLASVSDLVGQPGIVVADPSGASVERLPPPDGGRWLLVVGPEGGLAPDELVALPGPRIGLGPHVLRAETAAIAGAAVLTSRRLEVA